MPDCSVLGPNYSEDPVTGACIYTPSEVGSEDFLGTVESLGFSEDFIGTTFEDDPETPELEYGHYFDEYIKDEEDKLRSLILGDVSQFEEIYGWETSQLGEDWVLKQEQLLDAWDLKKKELTGIWELKQSELSKTWDLAKDKTSLDARTLIGKLGAAKTTARDTGMFYHGGAEQTIKTAESDIMAGYRGGRKTSKSIYDIGMEGGKSVYDIGTDLAALTYGDEIATGGMTYQQALDDEYEKRSHGITDLYQKLDLAIHDLRSDWMEGERDTLDNVLLSGIFNECETDADCPTGSCDSNGICGGSIDPIITEENIYDPQYNANMEVLNTILEGYGFTAPPFDPDDPEGSYEIWLEWVSESQALMEDPSLLLPIQDTGTGGGPGLVTVPTITLPTPPDFGVTPTPPGTSPTWGGTYITGTSSDRRLKENIELVGKSSSGINVYQWNYKSYPGKRYQGVMADEVPNASVVMPDGYLAVDYSKVDVDFVEV